MITFRCIAAGALALSGLLSVTAVANASPLAATVPGSAAAFAPSGDGLVHKVAGCHKHGEYHMVYLWGYQAWHRHSNNCQPKPASPPNYGPPVYNPPAYPGYPVNPGYPAYPGYPGYGGGNVYCHANWQDHYHPGWGGGWHRHVGPGCVPHRGKRWKGGSKKNCVNIAGIWICG